MYSILIRVPDSAYDSTVSAFSELGTAGLIEEQPTIRAFFERRDKIDRAARIFSPSVLEIREEEPILYHIPDISDPLLVGAKFFIAPDLCDAPTPPGRVRISLEAQSAFGSGRHESTQLMLKAIEKYLQPGMTTLDVGCGSGILSVAARLLGATRTFACDIDPHALAVASRISNIELFAGSADAVRDGVADLVLANISARVVDALAGHLHRVTKPRGTVLISGFIADHEPRRFKPEEIVADGEWQCWICRRDPLLAAERNSPGKHDARWW